MPNRHFARLVSEEDILYEAALKRRALGRTIIACVLILMGCLSVAASIYPIILKSTIPLMWVNEANANGWSKQLESIGVHLLARGRIEAYPLWMCMVAATAGCLLLWAGATLIRLKDETQVWASLLTRAFWTKAYLWRERNEVVSVRRTLSR